MKRLAELLIAGRVSPNAISVFGTLCALACFLLLRQTAHDPSIPWTGSWLAAGSGRLHPLGEIFNEFPDRISDALILVGLGQAAGGDAFWGWLATCGALIVAYLRAFGASLGAGQIFAGPAAKQQRMFLATLACVIMAFGGERWLPAAPTLALQLISLGCVLTVIRRLILIANYLKQR